MAEDRIDMAEAAALYGGRGLDDYDNIPPEANDFPSPFGRGTDDGLTAGDNRQAGPRRQDARPDGREPGQPKDYSFGKKPVEYDFAALEQDGAHAAAKRLRRLRDLIGAAPCWLLPCGFQNSMRNTTARSRNLKINFLPNASPLGGRDF